MKQAKTVKYFINSYLSDSVVSNQMEVSKTVFDKQFKQVVEKYQNQETVKDDEFHVDMDTWHFDHDTYTEEKVSFVYSICSIDFVKLICKDGYHFKK